MSLPRTGIWPVERGRALSWRLLADPRVPGALCAVVLAATAVSAAYDLAKVAAIAVGQLGGGSAVGADFLNLYAGAALFLHQPSATYSLDAQLALQRGLTQRASLLVPFYLPPHGGVLVMALAGLPYGVAYIAWLAIGIICLVAAAWWLAPHWTPAYALVWLALGLAFLPVTLGLAQGQTSALMLACFALIARDLLSPRPRSLRLGLGLLGWTLKPQFAPWLIVAAILQRRWRGLALLGSAIALLTAVAAWRLGADGLAAYQHLAAQKTAEALWADPTFLIGPTLLHAAQWWFGPTWLGLAIAAGLIAVAVACGLRIWRGGFAPDNARLLQVGSLPVLAIVTAPYALIYELTMWLAAFWLVWRFTAGHAAARAGLLWLTLSIMVSAAMGVGDPLGGGADASALLGLAWLGFVVGLMRAHERRRLLESAANHIGRTRGGARS